MQKTIMSMTKNMIMWNKYALFVTLNEVKGLKKDSSLRSE